MHKYTSELRADELGIGLGKVTLFAPSKYAKSKFINSSAYVVCIQNRKVQNSFCSVGNCSAITSSASLEKMYIFV
jgi:hypothetical protein